MWLNDPAVWASIMSPAPHHPQHGTRDLLDAPDVVEPGPMMPRVKQQKHAHVRMQEVTITPPNTKPQPEPQPREVARPAAPPVDDQGRPITALSDSDDDEDEQLKRVIERSKYEIGPPVDEYVVMLSVITMRFDDEMQMALNLSRIESEEYDARLSGAYTM